MISCLVRIFFQALETCIYSSRSNSHISAYFLIAVSARTEYIFIRKKKQKNDERIMNSKRKTHKKNKSCRSCLPCLLFSYCLCLYCLSAENKLKWAVSERRIRDDRKVIARYMCTVLAQNRTPKLKTVAESVSFVHHRRNTYMNRLCSTRY